MQEKIKCILKYLFESWEFFQCDNCGKKLSSKTVRARISWNLESAQKLSTNFTCNLPGGSRTWQAPNEVTPAASLCPCCRCSGTSATKWRLTNIFTCSLPGGTSAQMMALILCKGDDPFPLRWPSGWGSWCDRSQPRRAGPAGCTCRVGLRKNMVQGGISINAQGFGLEKSLRRMELYGSRFASTFSGCPSQGTQSLQSRWRRATGRPGSLPVNLCLKLGGMERPLQECLILPTFAF